MNLSRPRKLMFLAVLWLATELLAGVCLWITRAAVGVTYDPVITSLSELQKTKLEQFLREGSGPNYGQHPALGWVPTKEANAAGMRDDREYDSRPGNGVLRISAFGDSFIYGSDVSLHESWLKQLGSLAPGVEVLNYGVGAYGTDQAYLRYRAVGTEYHPHIVFIGYMSENLARNVNIFRAFYTPWYRDVIFTKPRFELRDGRLRLISNPIATHEAHQRLLNDDLNVLRELGQHDYHYRINYQRSRFDLLPTVRLARLFAYQLRTRVINPIFSPSGSYNADSEAFRVTVAIIDAFYRQVLQDGALPIIVVLPDVNDQQDSLAKRPRRYAPLLDDFRRKGYRFIDTLAAFEAREPRDAIEELTVAWGHFSPLGGSIAAHHVMEQLRGWNYLDLQAVANATVAEQTRRGVRAD